MCKVCQTAPHGYPPLPFVPRFFRGEQCVLCWQITAINDRSSQNDDRAYAYDGLNRLVSATGIWGSANYQYDALNNLEVKSIGRRFVNVEYDANNRISLMHDTDEDVYNSYSHDARGNVTGDGRHAFTYDRANQPTALSGSGNSATFEYDGNYRRVKQEINGETVYSFYSLSGEMVYRDNITTGQNTDYIKLGAGGMTILRCRRSSCEYLFNDHLGTPVASAAGNGTIRYREVFTPFGEVWGASHANTIDQDGFTGHIRDTDTGLTYMQARYYDPVIGRFLSNDPVGFAEGGAPPSANPTGSLDRNLPMTGS